MPVTLAQVISIADPLFKDHFDLWIPNPPGGGDGEGMLIQNMSASLPTTSNESRAIELHRHKTGFAGKLEYNHKFSSEFVVLGDLLIYNALMNWQAQVVIPGTNLPRPRIEYVADAVVRQYAVDNTVAIARTMWTMFPTKVSELKMDGSQNTPQTVSVEWWYDYFTEGEFIPLSS